MKLNTKNFTLDDSLLFSVEQIKEALNYSHNLSIVVLDLESLAMETGRGQDQVLTDNYLTPGEQQQLETFSYDKRRNEWLGGRISAKIAAARCMAKGDTGQETVVAWQNIAIENQDSGRPFLVLGAQRPETQNMPDISISHSKHLASAMAVSQGKCGIDIQQASPKTVKVKERFCGPEESTILQGLLPDASDMVRLTLLWAAKEALRKAADTTPVPGFLELQLMEIYTASQGLWCLVFDYQASRDTGLKVAVGQVDDYFLAVTFRSDTLE